MSKSRHSGKRKIGQKYRRAHAKRLCVISILEKVSDDLSRTIFITAGEASGDQHVAALAVSLRKIFPNCRMRGLGGMLSEANGVKLIAETTSSAAMGLAAAGKALQVMGWLKAAERSCSTDKPDLFICVDSWSMNRHFADLGKRLGVPVLYFVAPQAWGWRPGRVKKMRQCIDHLACLLPFEEAWYRERGVKATYVGHPLFDKLAVPSALPKAALGGRGPVVGLLPGSRKSEAAGNWPRLKRVGQMLAQRHAGIRFLVPTTQSTDTIVRSDVLEGAEIKQDAFDQMVPQCDVVVTVSGTATLHVALHGVPMVIVYRGNPVLWHGIGRWVIPTRTFGLINLLAGNSPRPTSHLMPEFVPWYGSVQPVADLVSRWLDNAEERQQLRSRLVEVIAKIHKPGATDRVANIAAELISGNKTKKK